MSESSQPIPELSVVVPVFNEARNLRPLAARLASVLAELKLSFEVVLIDDVSRD
jgi:glycosyltransferase involved in cell wall biosynthesis